MSLEAIRRAFFQLSYLCWKQMNQPPKWQATLFDKIICTKGCNSKCAFYAYLSTSPSTRVHLSKSGNVDLTRQVVRHQGPTEPKHSQHSAVKSRAFSNRLKATI